MTKEELKSLVDKTLGNNLAKINEVYLGNALTTILNEVIDGMGGGEKIIVDLGNYEDSISSIDDRNFYFSDEYAQNEVYKTIFGHDIPRLEDMESFKNDVLSLRNKEIIVLPFYHSDYEFAFGGLYFSVFVDVAGQAMELSFVNGNKHISLIEA